MLQVDVAWQYAFGALFATMAMTQLKNTERAWWDNKYFIVSLLFSALLFVPTGTYLLWEFPHWESMQVFSSRVDPFLISIIPVIVCITNVTQCILGFYVTTWLIRKEKYALALLQNTIGYYAFVFMLVHGWDGTGWSRFLYDPTVHGGVLWTSVEASVATTSFLLSNVWFTLLVMACFLAPFILYFSITWQKEVDKQAGKESKPIDLLKFIGIGSFGVIIFPVIFSLFGGMFSVLLTVLVGGVVGPYIGIFVGIPIVWILGYLLLFREGMPLNKVAITMVKKYKNL